MNKKHLPFQIDLTAQYDNLEMLFTFEGGAFFFATRNNKYYVISDEGTMADFFEDDEEMLAMLKTEYEFDSKDKCRNYIQEIIAKKRIEQGNFRLPDALL